MKPNMMIAVLCTLALVFSGCNSENQTSKPDEDVEYLPLSTKDGTDQHVSNEVKNILREFEEIKTIKAVNSPKKVIIAVEIKHSKRLNMEKHKKTYTEAVGNAFPDMITELSTDKKLIIEIDRLEEALNEKNISRRELEIKIQKLIKLMHKKT